MVVGRCSSVLNEAGTTFFRCHLRATEIRLNAMFSNCWNIKCSVNVLAQIGVFLRVGF